MDEFKLALYGRLFNIRAIVNSVDAANEYMEANAGTGVIHEAGGAIFIVDKADSGLPYAVTDRKAERMAERKARKTRADELAAALAECMADLSYPEEGNPWRLDSLRRGSELLTGEEFGFDCGPVFKARAAKGTTGGRFHLPGFPNVKGIRG